MPQKFTFFQKSMLALLGGQDVQQAMVNFFILLCEYFPVEAITFDQYMPHVPSLVVHYVVSEQGFFTTDIALSLTIEERQHVEEAEMYPHRPRMIPDSSTHSLSCKHANALKAYFPLRHRCNMVNMLRVDEKVIGHLVCLGREVHCFTPQHTELMNMVLPAVALIIAKMLKMEDMGKQNAAMRHEHGRLQRELGVLADADILGAQGAHSQVVASIRQLADKDTPVLILGETGTGKELVADAIQKHSLRSQKAFIKVNCGALSETLLDSELFGHVRGAFTGAHSTRPGRFELADGGTLFLDEVGELPLPAQVRLLRVLQDGTFERIGASRQSTVNVRIIAATHRDLRLMCRQGLFREDLFHRLNVFPIHMPPLRQRREDIPLLTRHLSARVAQRLGMPKRIILMECMDKLVRYSWPGNVRELENLIERAMVQTPDGPLDLTHFLPAEGEYQGGVAVPPPVLPGNTGFQGQGMNSALLDHYLEQKFASWQARMQGAVNINLPESKCLPTEAQPEARIRAALQQCNGKVYGPGGAAELLGVNHNTLRSRMRKLGIVRR